MFSGAMMIGFFGLIISMIGIGKSRESANQSALVNYLGLAVCSTIFIVFALIINVLLVIIS
jgi:hypothetical protein